MFVDETQSYLVFRTTNRHHINPILTPIGELAYCGSCSRLISLDFFNFETIISLDFFNFCLFICLDFFNFCIFAAKKSEICITIES